MNNKYTTRRWLVARLDWGNPRC